MELLVFGHAGARVIIFPTSKGRYLNREARHDGHHDQHLENGWLQIYCVNSIDTESS